MAVCGGGFGLGQTRRLKSSIHLDQVARVTWTLFCVQQCRDWHSSLAGNDRRPLPFPACRSQTSLIPPSIDNANAPSCSPPADNPINPDPGAVPDNGRRDAHLRHPPRFQCPMVRPTGQPLRRLPFRSQRAMHAKCASPLAKVVRFWADGGPPSGATPVFHLRWVQLHDTGAEVLTPRTQG